MLYVDQSLSEEDAIGIGRKGTINKPQFLNAPFWTVDTLFYMTPLRNESLIFLYTWCQNVRWEKYDESTGVPSLSKRTIDNIPLSSPILEEQIRIGSIFQKVDKAIASNQRQ